MSKAGGNHYRCAGLSHTIRNLMEDRVPVSTSAASPLPGATGSAVTPIPIAADEKKSGKPGPEHGGVKDTIESIVIAFILAFVFRAFVVEAFVIPTGSMAPTLLGAHTRLRCDDCGYEFTVNVESPSRDAQGLPTDDIQIPKAVQYGKDPACPNCGNYVRANPPGKSLDVHYGDRILVLKYLYLFQEPNRWDTVVFKSPNDVPAYAQNYIKRLVGKPGEQIMLLDGDVYVRDAESADGPYIVQTKPYAIQHGLWRIIYDNDYHPQRPRLEGEMPWVQPWQVANGNGWTLDGEKSAGGRIFHFDNASAGAMIRFNQQANPAANHFTEWLAYDQYAYSRGTIGNSQDAIVTDLKIALFYERRAGDGPLRLGLTKRDRSFVAEIGVDQVRLLDTTNGNEKELGTAVTGSPSSRPMHIEFTNVDYQLTLRINGEKVLQSTPEQYAPDLSALLADFRSLLRNPAQRTLTPPPAVTIEARNQTCDLSHVGLFRDIAYTSPGKGDERYWGNPRSDNLQIKLGQGEYFVLGDNSAISGDARLWRDPIHLPHEDLQAQAGVVPERFLLGKAFFVYWPAGYSPISSLPALTPNFGAMRFIH